MPLSITVPTPFNVNAQLGLIGSAAVPWTVILALVALISCPDASAMRVTPPTQSALKWPLSEVGV